MRRIASITAAVLCLAAPAAFAAPQAPHDFASGIDCVDCHTPYGGFNDPALANGTATDSTSTVTTLVDGVKAWGANQWAGGVITFTTGLNAGQFRTITSNTATTVTWSGALDTAPVAADEYKISKADQADVETKCSSCHNPSGMASGLAVVSQHQTDKGALGCGKCHDPHNTVPNTGVGNGLIREKLTFNGEKPVVYPSGGANAYITDAGTPGLCQACHTKTAYFKADRTGDDTHNAATTCVGACHGHADGFGTAANGQGHMDPAGLAFTYASATGTSCARCHTASGAATFQAAFIANGQTAVPANPPAGAMGPFACATCHNANADALTKIPFQSANVVVTAPDQPTALCSQCHQGRNSTPAVNNTLGVNYNGTASGGTTTTMTVAASTFTLNLVGAVIQFTNGTLFGQVRNITAYDATSVTFTPALASAPTATTTFRIAGNVAAANDLDTVTTKSFANVHYHVAAGTLFGGGFPALGGTGTQVGYEYAQIGAETSFRKYAMQNFHVASKDGCTDCHEQHTGHVKIDTCGDCHKNEIGAAVATVEELEDSRIFGWEEADFDGDGVEEGLKVEIDGIAEILYAAIQAYAVPVSGQAICYDIGPNPYWFKDTNANGVCDGTYVPTTHVATGEIVSSNSFNGKWTARLMKAAYNYQMFKKDPGAWAHNPMYMIELLHDSITDLNVKLTALGIPVAFNGTRTRFGHFDQDSDVFRHWDYTATNKVDAACSQCHAGAEGLANYLADPMTALTSKPVFGMGCLTCHPALPNGDPDFAQSLAIASVRFPPRPAAGVTVVTTSMGNATDNLCATCHSARESKSSIDVAIGATVDTSWTLSFKNSHYLGSAAVLAGNDAQVGYQYPAKTYAGPWMHDTNPASCTVCHDPVATKHTFEVAKNTAYCATCHTGTDYLTYKGGARATVDYDGDLAVENLPDELNGMMARLYTAIQDYCTANAHTCTYGANYPYWVVTGATTKLNPKALKAAFNYNFLVKAEGAWAHNFSYAAQLVYDSIEDLSGDLTGLVRP